MRPRELPAALEAVRAFPSLRFVIDHLGKPDIAGGAFDAWAALIRPFGPEAGHVWCKLSGMATEADWASWATEDLQPYVHEAVRVFGPSRCLYGSDWPVCLLAGSYARILCALKEAIAHLSPDERARILAGSARELYRLEVPHTPL